MPDTQAGEYTNLLQAVNTDDNENLHFGYNVSLAQTFTLTAWTLVSIAVTLVDYPGSDAKMWCHVHSTDGAGKPTGSPWAIGYFHRLPYKNWATRYWATYVFDPPPLLPAGQFCIELIGGFVPEFLMWAWRLNDAPTPPSTEKCWRSLDFGYTWAQLPDQVFLHEIWGWEPPPDAPSPPETIYWAPIDEEELAWDDSFTIVVTTESKCHLYMRWTLEPPLKHKVSRIVRGITLSNETRYCFVAFHENEQIEPGDTLIHTFIKPNWPICQTRYFYFIGSKQRQESPSASPLFSLHREKIEMPSQILTPNGDGALAQLISTDDPHYLAILEDDSVYLPPNGGGTWGYLTGHYVRKNWWPWGYATDLYTFTDPLWVDLPIQFITAWYLCGRDTYPYGWWKSALRIAAVTYRGDAQPFDIGLAWKHYTWYTNPATGNPWTHDDLTALQAGITMNKVGSYGNTWCDAIHIEIKY